MRIWVKLERATSAAHQFVYFRDNGRFWSAGDEREPKEAGLLAAYVWDQENDKVWRLTNGKVIPVKEWEFVLF